MQTASKKRNLEAQRLYLYKNREPKVKEKQKNTGKCPGSPSPPIPERGTDNHVAMQRHKVFIYLECSKVPPSPVTTGFTVEPQFSETVGFYRVLHNN